MGQVMAYQSRNTHTLHVTEPHVHDLGWLQLYSNITLLGVPASLSLMEWKREEGKGAEGRGRKKRNKRHDKTMNKAKQSCVYLKLYTKLIIPSAFLIRLA